jgi:hypothetical protein
VRDGLKRLAGRCACGVALELVGLDPDAHLPCEGRKRCRACGEAKPVAAYHRANYGRSLQAICKACHRAVASAWSRKQFKANTPYAERQRAAKREDHAHPVLAEMKRAANRRWWATRGRARTSQQSPATSEVA